MSRNRIFVSRSVGEIVPVGQIQRLGRRISQKEGRVFEERVIILSDFGLSCSSPVVMERRICEYSSQSSKRGKVKRLAR